MAYSENGRCPEGFFPVPRLQLSFEFPERADVEGGRLSSSPAYSNHADYMKAWLQEPFERLVRECIRSGHGCNLGETARIAAGGTR